MPEIDTLAELIKQREEARQVLTELRAATKDAHSVRKELMLLISRGAPLLLNQAVNEYFGKELPIQVDIIMKRVEHQATRVINSVARKIAQAAEKKAQNGCL